MDVDLGGGFAVGGEAEGGAKGEVGGQEGAGVD